ncbi:hypothetical protein EVAR_33203_1 [Eumeta japonica]|uniref:Uncharacterized protein n=1 Tax=Eumeta variegata TaxID=151549 RepID=A0A4C1W1B8_EUMVA|nr:hypothetical protein EVAR_33203_1 [Eumeta japonica]
MSTKIFSNDVLSPRTDRGRHTSSYDDGPVSKHPIPGRAFIGRSTSPRNARASSLVRANRQRRRRLLGRRRGGAGRGAPARLLQRNLLSLPPEASALYGTPPDLQERQENITRRLEAGSADDPVRPAPRRPARAPLSARSRWRRARPVAEPPHSGIINATASARPPLPHPLLLPFGAQISKNRHPSNDTAQYEGEPTTPSVHLYFPDICALRLVSEDSRRSRLADPPTERLGVVARRGRYGCESTVRPETDEFAMKYLMDCI